MNSEPTTQNNPAEQTQPDNLRLSLPQDFTATRTWPEEIIVEPSRLAWTLWGDTEGDITAAYSGDKRPKVQTFVHEGQRFTNMGGSEYSVHCYPLLSPEHYAGNGKVKYSYEGETVIYESAEVHAWPESHVFIPCADGGGRNQPVVPHVCLWRIFVSGKTYQEMLLDFLEG